MELDFFTTFATVACPSVLIFLVCVCLVIYLRSPRRIYASAQLSSCLTTVLTDPCCVCMEAKANTVLTCGHTDLCLTCALKLTTCPLCRQRIYGVRLSALP